MQVLTRVFKNSELHRLFMDIGLAPRPEIAGVQTLAEMMMAITHDTRWEDESRGIDYKGRLPMASLFAPIGDRWSFDLMYAFDAVGFKNKSMSDGNLYLTKADYNISFSRLRVTDPDPIFASMLEFRVVSHRDEAASLEFLGNHGLEMERVLLARKVAWENRLREHHPSAN